MEKFDGASKKAWGAFLSIVLGIVAGIICLFGGMFLGFFLMSMNLMLGMIILIVFIMIGFSILMTGIFLDVLLQYLILKKLDPKTVSDSGSNSLHNKARLLFPFYFMGIGCITVFLLVTFSTIALQPYILSLLNLRLDFLFSTITTKPLIDIPQMVITPTKQIINPLMMIEMFDMSGMIFFFLFGINVFFILGTIGHVLFCIYLFILGDEKNIGLLQATCFLLIFIEPVGLILLALSLKKL